ncbi:2'-5' RNA ligase family protein [Modestobacter sp. I12A-02628]|uniref:2'-5' RNA ligase family protein n=1 Tax=Goekera deserti TaxID=2497753 RepID=A0A7K3WA13_9ACTN|nr:2'-5' RNA ligase family protein [Goekera deserti]NDI49446.1 2'-5' RNA ligase family protein [Goekera deserti]NEL52680.1 2'-5' RNA ligase family protein [Goekera deserti]
MADRAGSGGRAGDRAGDTVVVGVVVPVPEPWAQLLVDWRAKVGDPQASMVPPHVTLLPPTAVPVAERTAVTEHLCRVAAAHPAFDVHLAGTGTFRPISEVVFVAVALGIADCELIAADVRSGPLERSLNFPYHPHVTVAQDVPTDMLDLAYAGLSEVQAEFRVDHFQEFEQRPGGEWTIARRYPLTGPPR